MTLALGLQPKLRRDMKNESKNNSRYFETKTHFNKCEKMQKNKS
jgi:hypothetical protein